MDPADKAAAEAARADNKAARERAVEDRKKMHEENKRLREEQRKSNEARMAADAKLRPTPTPDELSRAMVGDNVDQKEPDGSPEQNPLHPIENAAQQIEVGHKMVETKPAAAPYANRQATTKPTTP